ncbi:AMP-binding protein [uncultured Shewanella sp.]|uniref:phenylacetate--CoA ligase family protein n=1 Tax=uncultured Shewanella sp. TaxID=173975 RepID=UPI00263994FD|nr:AMP-binding protein [uncultured Shewanella sp.]
MNSVYDSDELQSRTRRESDLLTRLPAFLAYAKQECAHYRRTLSDIDVTAITSRQSLTSVPVTRKSDLICLQAENLPFAGLNASGSTPDRIFQSPGPIFEPGHDSKDWWRMGTAFYAAGFRAGERVQNCLSYHLSPGGFIMDSGARACGCSVIPAGPGQTEQQLDIIERLRPEGYCGTPSFLNILLQRAKELGRDVSSINKALVSGEALTPTLQARFEEAGISVSQAYATADIGLIAYESCPDSGLVVAEDILLEILRPGSQEPVADGEVGEVVVTSFNPDYPLIRFATGDLSSVMPGMSPCGRTNMRIRGWQGRADQSTKVKGMFIHPEQVERIRLSHSLLAKARLVVTNIDDRDQMTLHCEVSDAGRSDIDITEVAQTMREVTKLGGHVELVAPGSLSDDGIVIEDLR